MMTRNRGTFGVALILPVLAWAGEASPGSCPPKGPTVDPVLSQLGGISSAAGEQANGAALAEYQRLLEELRKLSGRNVYVGADRVFRQMLELRGQGVEIDFEAWELGALAARGIGDVGMMLDRYKGALQAPPPGSVHLDDPGIYDQYRQRVDQMALTIAQIEGGYGLVKGAIPPESGQQERDREAYVRQRDAARAKGRPFDASPPRIFEPADGMPFDPAAAAAIKFAQEKYLETGRYSGWLPAGTYRITGANGSVAEFTVSPKEKPIGSP